MQTQRLFELLVVGGSLWLVSCGGGVSPGGEGTQAPGVTQTPSDGGVQGEGEDEGGGSQFW